MFFWNNPALNIRAFLGRLWLCLGIPSVVALLIALLTFNADAVRITGILVVSVFAVYLLVVVAYLIRTLILLIVRLVLPAIGRPAIFALLILLIAMLLPIFTDGPVYNLEELISPLISPFVPLF